MAQSDCIYLNHAGTSWPKPDPVRKAVRSAEQIEPPLWPPMLQESHQTVADFFHVKPERLLLTPGCTAALSIATQDHRWQTGDCVVSSQFEHHALHRNLVKLSERGVEVRTIRSSQDELVDLADLESILRTSRVRLVAMNAACNVTGAILPIREVIELAHRFGALVLIDGAQIAGWWDLDLNALGVDLFTFAGHKALQGPWGIGGLFVRDGVMMNSPPAGCESSPGGQESCSMMPGYCDVGSVNQVALAGLAAACWWLSDSERSGRLGAARELTAQLASHLRDLPGIRLLHDFAADLKLPTLAVTFQNQSPAEVATRLRERSIISSAGFQCAPSVHEALKTRDQGILRLSLGPTTRLADIECAVQVIQDTVRES